MSIKFNPSKSLIVTLTLSIVFVLIAIHLFYTIDDVKDLTKWPIVQGVVTDLQELRKEECLSDDEICYHIKFEYKYRVGSVDYIGYRYDLRPLGYFDSIVSSNIYIWLGFKHPVGSPIKVYYNPQNPSFALIHPKAPMVNYITFFVSCLCALLTFGKFIVLIYQRTEKQINKKIKVR